ncbi:MAG: pseudouridine synthase [Alphaproteobacteria bacterium]|nr:pseudouridine synthase [Alphaproteobacteria bacterium]
METNNNKERIAKVIAQRCGLSRRQAEQAILDGRVMVNHELLITPAHTVAPTDVIMLDHELLKPMNKPFVILYHKPVDYVCSHKAQKGQKTIYTAIKAHDPPDTFLRHVGRLDIASEGLVVLTNCPQTAHSLQHQNWKKQYKVRLQCILTPQHIKKLESIKRIDGYPITPMKVELIRQTSTNCWAQFTLWEGRNRQIRKALESISSRASRIIRTHYGPFSLEGIPTNKYRQLPFKDFQGYLAEIK